MIEIAICIFLIAILYSSVGHGGASGYIAIFALFGYSTIFIRQDALILNILASSMAVFSFYKAGYFSTKLFVQLISFSVPAAFLGGSFQLSPGLYKYILGGCLVIPAILLFFNQSKVEKTTRLLPFYQAAFIGAVLGFLSGITGIGGGVFLSPILIFGRWANQKTTAAVSAAFILVNSISGLVGASAHQNKFDNNVLYFGAAVLAGAFIGSQFGANKFEPHKLRMLLGIVLLIAACKLLFY